ncbi:uncharacterized protein L969DRAFT_623810 [Mixia osmundae IAM 14324]|uniref:Zinc finger PHD-type domain-containing protein n=1 Tax=Mixia osmundae (strain CBS 9802 / IAM 14324 / JCM 22182 / KY 12970) TaxID=764103 RepID=G7E1X2_MIXOS|nr:uncharacterized protein L969DRAFT_623810 [Mixia osmundae IAM 14324]KEI38658.1 hypothetical protein L969DRAFT_623810 [Mixia osmundae IAM 14324]GAA96885.1 hypothetical protein E5Q_03558 [Mixia osmundae IAM 14324]
MALLSAAALGLSEPLAGSSQASMSRSRSAEPTRTVNSPPQAHAREHLERPSDQLVRSSSDDHTTLSMRRQEAQQHTQRFLTDAIAQSSGRTMPMSHNMALLMGRLDQDLTQSPSSKSSDSPAIDLTAVIPHPAVEQGQLVVATTDSVDEVILDALTTQDGEQQQEEYEGVIRCICGLEDDDGFSIQCERCTDWQHAICVRINPDSVPDEYFCELCAPRETNGAQARARQQLRIKYEFELQAARDPNAFLTEDDELYYRGIESAEARERAAAALLVLDEDSGDYVLASSFAPKRKRSTLTPQTALETVEDDNNDEGKRQRTPPLAGARKRQKSAKRGRPPTQANLPQTPMNAQGGSAPATPAPGQETSNRRELRPSTTGALATPFGLSKDTVAAAAENVEEQDPWLYEYTAIDDNRLVDRTAVSDRLTTAMQWFVADQDFVRQQAADNGYLAIRGKRSSKSYDASLQYFTDPLTPVYLDDELPAPAKLVIAPLQPNAFCLAPSTANPFAQLTTTPTLACPYPRPITHAVYANDNISTGSFIAELRGEISTLEQYRQSPVNQYAGMGVPKPYVRSLTAPWSLAIDSRQYGNDTRFIRTGCHPNAVVLPVIVAPKPYTEDEAVQLLRKPTVKFGVFALTFIAKRDEIVLPWDWDDNHLVHLLPDLLLSEEPSLEPDAIEDVSRKMASVLATLLGSTTCACQKRKDCSVVWMWRLAAATTASGRGAQTQDDAVKAALQNVLLAARDGGSANSRSKATRRKHNSSKRPELGSLVGMYRSWLGRDELPELIEDDSDGQDDQKRTEESEAPVTPASEAIDEDVEPPPSAKRVRKMINDYDSDSDATDPLAGSPEPEPAVFRAPSVARSSSQEPALVAKELQSIFEDASPSAEVDSPAKEALLAPIETAAVPIEMPIEQPQVKTPTPPPPPEPVKPKATLSFAAFRKRLASKKPLSPTVAKTEDKLDGGKNTLPAGGQIEDAAEADIISASMDTPSAALVGDTPMTETPAETPSNLSFSADTSYFPQLGISQTLDAPPPRDTSPPTIRKRSISPVVTHRQASPAAVMPHTPARETTPNEQGDLSSPPVQASLPSYDSMQSSSDRAIERPTIWRRDDLAGRSAFEQRGDETGVRYPMQPANHPFAEDNRFGSEPSRIEPPSGPRSRGVYIGRGGGPPSGFVRESAFNTAPGYRSSSSFTSQGTHPAHASYRNTPQQPPSAPRALQPTSAFASAPIPAYVTPATGRASWPPPPPSTGFAFQNSERARYDGVPKGPRQSRGLGAKTRGFRGGRGRGM